MACPGCSPDCAPNLVACTGTGQRVPKVAHGKVPCMHNNTAELPCERSNKLGGTCSHVPKMKPPSRPKALKQMQHVVQSNTNFAGAIQSFCGACGGSAISWQLVAFSKSHPSAFQSRMVWLPIVLVVGGLSHGNMSSELIHDVSPQSLLVFFFLYC